MNKPFTFAAALFVCALAAGCASTTVIDRSGSVGGSGTSTVVCDLQAAQTAAGALDNAAAPMYGCGATLPR